jgi:3-oxoacyl-[acyl-carrier protein] reductase
VAYAEIGVRSVVGYFAGDPHDPSETQNAVDAIGGQCIMVETDVRSTASCEGLVAAAMSTFGRIDAVVANAGILAHAPIEQLTDESWDNVLAVDLSGVMKIFRAAVPHVQEGGALVAVSSMSGAVYGWGDHAHYTAAKAGVVGLVRSLAVELGPRGIRANIVVPGVTETPQALHPSSLGRAGLERAAHGIPLKRVAAPSEIAKVIRFLTGPDSSYMTGSEVRVDGGITIRQAT